MDLDWADQIAPATRTRALVGCLFLAAIIAASDRFVVPNASLGILYIFPILILAVFLPRWQILACALAATILREQFGPGAWQADAPARLATGLIAFSGAGLFVAEMVRRHRIEADSVMKLTAEIALRREAEEDARLVIKSSPAAIITVNPDGCIDQANEAACRLLGFDSEATASGQNMKDYFPMLGDLFKSKRAVSLTRTMLEGSGLRQNGEMFFVQMWLSSYKTAAGTKLTAVIADASEHLRDREELGLRQLLMNSRIVVEAISHEIRNLAAAAEVLHGNIGRSCGLGKNEDFQALGRLTEAMRKVSSAELPASAEQVLAGVDVNTLIKELNIILSSGWNDSELELRWEIANDLPRVRADHSGLLQVFLNLTQNSRRILSGKSGARITITAYRMGELVVVGVADNGPGIAAPEALFQPFQRGATSAGLGLYVSRAIVRTYGGELRYIRRVGGAGFLIELPVMAHTEATASA